MSRTRLFVLALQLLTCTAAQFRPPRGGGGSTGVLKKRSTKEGKPMAIGEGSSGSVGRPFVPRRLPARDFLRSEASLPLPSSSSSSLPKEGITPPISKEQFLTLSAFLAGFSDVLCYKRYGCYANMITGNMIRCVFNFAEWNVSEVIRTGRLLTGYALGAMLFRLILRRAKEKDPKLASAASPKIVAPITLAALCLADITGFQPLLAFAGSVINSATMESTGGTVTYAITGHFIKTCNSMVDGALNRLSIRVLASLCCGVVISAGLLAHTNLLTHLPVFTLLGAVYLVLFALYGGPAHRRMYSLDWKQTNEEQVEEEQSIFMKRDSIQGEAYLKSA